LGVGKRLNKNTCSPRIGRVIHVRGVRVSDDDAHAHAHELVRRLTSVSGGEGFVDRLERALVMNGGADRH
jgi:hypothetical protein